MCACGRWVIAETVEEQMIGCKEAKEFKDHIIRWIVHMDAIVLKNGYKNNAGRKDNDPENKSSMNERE